MKPKIIGTGLSGLVASRVVELLKDKYDFVDFSLDTEVNILDFDRLGEAFAKHADAQAVLHFAAFTDTTAAWNQRNNKSGVCYQLNVLGTKNVLQCCRQIGKYLVYVSTDYVFDGLSPTPYTEDDRPSPVDWYGQTKFLAEKEVTGSGLPTAIVRLATPFRAHFDPKKDLVRRILEGLSTGHLYPLFTDQITTPTFIDDLAPAFDYFIQNHPTGIYHLVGSSSQSPYELAIAIARIFGFDPNIIKKGSLVEYQKSQPAGSRPWLQYLSLSNQKATNLGLTFRTTQEALIDMKKQMG